jgi:hypothetical protein
MEAGIRKSLIIYSMLFHKRRRGEHPQAVYNRDYVLSFIEKNVEEY